MPRKTFSWPQGERDRGKAACAGAYGRSLRVARKPIAVDTRLTQAHNRGGGWSASGMLTTTLEGEPSWRRGGRRGHFPLPCLTILKRTADRGGVRYNRTAGNSFRVPQKQSVGPGIGGTGCVSSLRPLAKTRCCAGIDGMTDVAVAFAAPPRPPRLTPAQPRRTIAAGLGSRGTRGKFGTRS